MIVSVRAPPPPYLYRFILGVYNRAHFSRPLKFQIRHTDRNFKQKFHVYRRVRRAQSVQWWIKGWTTVVRFLRLSVIQFETEGNSTLLPTCNEKIFPSFKLYEYTSGTRPRVAVGLSGDWLNDIVTLRSSTSLSLPARITRSPSPANGFRQSP
jgi:hypothetical protein